jgi:hypothetical protein
MFNVFPEIYPFFLPKYRVSHPVQTGDNPALYLDVFNVFSGYAVRQITGVCADKGDGLLYFVKIDPATVR